MLKKFAVAIAAIIIAVTTTMGTVSAQQAQPQRLQVGRLACDVAPGIGLILGSSKSVSCVFHRDGHPNESYTGTITKIGLDIGITQRTHIEWLVLAVAGTPVANHALSGVYLGASSEATVGVGLGANWLIGGSNKAFALQPFSIQGQTGLNLSVAFASLTLR